MNLILQANNNRQRIKKFISIYSYLNRLNGGINGLKMIFFLNTQMNRLKQLEPLKIQAFFASGLLEFRVNPQSNKKKQRFVCGKSKEMKYMAEITSSDENISETGKEKKKKDRSVNYNRGYRGELIRILLTAGCISYKGLHLMCGSHSMYTRKLKQMREEGITEQKKLGRRRVEKLFNYNNSKDKYLSKLPPEYEKHYEQYGKEHSHNIGRWSSEKTSAERAYRTSEICMLMNGAGIYMFPDEKPELSSAEKIKVENEAAYFYTASEIKKATNFQLIIPKARKEEEKQKQKTENLTVNTRAIGSLFCKESTYMIYHSGGKVMKWNRSAEGQMSMHVGKIVRQLIPDTKETGGIRRCIIYANADKVFKSIFENDKKRLGLLTTNSGYDEMYLLPVNESGREFTSFMTRENWKETIKQEYLRGYETETVQGTIVCDGKDKRGSILLYCIPNINRLEKFIRAAEWSGDKNAFRIICFTFQESFVRSVAEEYAEVIVVSFLEFCQKHIWEEI